MTSPLQKYHELNNRSNKTYGLLSNEATAIIQTHKTIPIGSLLVVGRKGVINLNMLYNWWMIYAFQNHLIKDGKWIRPNETLDGLLADEYIKYGAQAGVPFTVQTYLRMIGHHLNYDNTLQLSQDQSNYLLNQENILQSEREKHKLK